MSIHPSAIIGPGVEIHPDAVIAPYAVITGNVKIGKGTRVESFVRIGAESGRVVIGENNHILSGACLGGPPQDLSYKGDDTQLVIGDNNVIREFVTINLGTTKGGGLTKIGNNCMLMAYVHIAHDCHLGDRVVIANSCQFAGHVVIGDNVRVGGMCGVAQFCRIGSYAYLAGDTKVNKDILPFTIAQGGWAKTRATNKIGLDRAGFSKEDIDKINRAVRFLIMGDRTLEEAIQKIETECLPSQRVEELLAYIRSSEAGIAR